jgi:ADP-ribose pyrophosphatase
VSDREPAPERVVASDRRFEGRICNVRTDTVEMENGKTAQREIVEHDPVVAIVPVDENGNVVLVRQYRLATEQVLLEVPAGIVEPGEDIEPAAQRELQEETGMRAGTLISLGGFYASPGFLTEYIHVFLAQDLTESRLDADDDEDIVVKRMPLSQALGLIDTGGIIDAKSIVGLLLASRRLSA